MAVGADEAAVEYDYSSNAILHLGSENGQTAEAVVSSTKAEKELIVSVTRIDRQLIVDAGGAGKPWQFLLKFRAVITGG